MQFSSDYINPYNTRLDRVRFAVKQLVPFGINDKEIINIGGGGNKHLQKSLKELNIGTSRDKYNLTALGIVRSKNIILNPDVNEIIKKDDILLIAGNNELIDKLTD